MPLVVFENCHPISGRLDVCECDYCKLDDKSTMLWRSLERHLNPWRLRFNYSTRTRRQIPDKVVTEISHLVVKVGHELIAMQITTKKQMCTLMPAVGQWLGVRPFTSMKHLEALPQPTPAMLRLDDLMRGIRLYPTMQQ